MGNLSKERLTPSRPFTVSGVNYAGSFWLKDRRSRGHKKYKSYICLFVCFSSKAIHLELVSTLTTSDFLTALKRFIARRGKPSDISSERTSLVLSGDCKLSYATIKVVF